MPSRVPAARFNEVRHSSMSTSLQSAGVLLTHTSGVSKLRAQSRPRIIFPLAHYVMGKAEIVPVEQLAAHAKSSTLYGRTGYK